MNIILKLFPVLLDTIKALTSKQGIKSKTVSKTVWLGAALIAMSGLQTILPDLTQELGAYGPLVSAGLGLVIVALRPIGLNALLRLARIYEVEGELEGLSDDECRAHRQRLTEAGCMAHARRKFIELHEAQQEHHRRRGDRPHRQAVRDRARDEGTESTAQVARATNPCSADCQSAAQPARRAARQDHKRHVHSQGDQLTPERNT